MKFLLKHRFSFVDVFIISLAAAASNHYGWFVGLVVLLAPIPFVVILEKENGIN